MDLNAINWSDLKFFVVVARCGSLAKAADKMRVTHSTVFRRINSLEASINMKLFARLSSGYELTDVGKEVFEYAEQISDRIDDLQRLLDNNNQHLRGTINVTAPHNLAYRYLPAYIREFLAHYPEIQINLLVSNNDFNLSRREADLAIRATSSPPEHLIGHKLFSLEWGAYASESYLDEFGRPQTLDDLQRHRLISATSDLVKLPTFDWIERHQPAQQVVMRCNDLVSMASASLAGVGIAMLPDDQARPELTRLFTFSPGARSDIWMLIHPDLRHSDRLKVFKEFIIKKFLGDEVFQQYGIFS